MKNSLTLIFLSLVIAISNAYALTAVHVTADDFVDMNTGDANNFGGSVSKSIQNFVGAPEGATSTVVLKFGTGTSSIGRDAYGVGSSTFGQSGDFFDGQYIKFGNSVNQMMLDFRITNNTGRDVKLRNINFDIRRAPGNANPTAFSVKYLASGDSALIKGATIETGAEMVNLVNVATGTIEEGVNNFTNNIPTNINNKAWIADSGYANFRLILTGTAGAQLDNVLVTVVPEPSTYALLSGLFAMTWIGLRRRATK